LTSEQHILSFWRNVEIFDLPDFKKDSSILRENTIFPWLQAERAPAQEDYKWQYTLIFGRIEKKKVINYIDTLLGTENEKQDWEDPITGYTCLSALLLDEDGRPDERSYVPAAYALGISLLEQKEDLSTISSVLTKAQEDFELRYNIPPQPQTGNEELARKGDTLTPLHLKAELDSLTDHVKGWNNNRIEVFLLAKEVYKTSKPDTGFLNSFYLSDLSYLSDINPKQYGKTLQEYLNLSISEKNRKDLINEKKYLFESIHPKFMTAGRWPSSIKFGLYTAQAGAVNTAFSQIGCDLGIQGINGPPGTGKTTLLLDVIAEIIVRRAKVLSELGANNLFEKKPSKIEKENGWDLWTYDLNEKLIGDYGIVVASNNNSAVENITKELPAEIKIDRDTFPDADYFSESAGKLIKEKSWGILSAALGKAKNRSDFKDAFWESDKKNGVTGFKDVLMAVYKDKQNDQSANFQKKFNETRDELRKHLDKFEVFKQQAGTFHESLSAYLKDKAERTRLQDIIAVLETELKKLESARSAALSQEMNAKESIEKIQKAMDFLTTNKPSFFIFHKLFNSQTYQEWKVQADNCFNEYNALRSKHEAAKGQLEEIKDQLDSATSKKGKAVQQVISVHKSIDLYLRRRENLHLEYGIDYQHLFDEDFEALPLEEIHLRMPYYSPAIAKLRSTIFLLSLDLHKYAILSNAGKVKNNLSTFFEMLTGRVNVVSGLSQNLWSTFFLCVPVVSTTLASAGKLFPNMNKDQIGWLLIDEAGQASPQFATGSLHRSRRSIIIGDPLQVEPVVTIPSQLVFKLRQQNKVDKIWSPSQTSAQQLADRISTTGTYMQNGFSEELIWTGYPLRAHRRCDDPMFTIANRIAYGEQMVKAVKENTTDHYIGPSQWFHIADNNPPINKHALKDEIQELKSKVNELQQAGFTGSVYVISPFITVANTCKAEFKENPSVSCGTIHKFQGKEADIVFLVLGSDPASPGARNWASQKPNMLNVAVTRAKKRIYVIGNKTLWAQCSYFDEMAVELAI
jgi:hypothetical protein